MKISHLLYTLTSLAVVTLFTGVAPASSLIVTDAAVASVYGATLNPSRDQTRITTRWNSYKSQYELTGFIHIALPELQQIVLTEGTLYLKTANRAHANASHEMVLGFTDDAFDPATLTVTTYDGVTPWTLGHNAGVNPGGVNPPFPNVLATVANVTATDTWYGFQSAALTQYLQQQLDRGEAAYFYLSQGKAGTAHEFVNFYGPGETATAQSVPYLALTYQSVPEPNAVALAGGIGLAWLLLRRKVSRRSGDTRESRSR